MSGQSIADDNTRKKNDDPITTIINRLNAIEYMMWPLIPLADQINAMETTLTEQGQQQQMLSTGLLRVEHRQGAARAPRQEAGVLEMITMTMRVSLRPTSLTSQSTTEQEIYYHG
ncbi:hypothetical protein GUJ93_ZPchr0002g25939 [Zizania palustris]|uniref:Uncharacterized protein n=1 Tax=Zizania palustris TaxID=103762 RepID=A0A8J5VUI3_ZIZPA|nr:hypothetical protein GUJ93_ZPchr0002g25939 [Zizania palustris]